MSCTIPAESTRQCMIEIQKIGKERFKKSDLPHSVYHYGIQGCLKRGWLKESPKFSRYDFELTTRGKTYIKRGCADSALDLPVKLMVNAVHVPVHQQGMIGDFRKEIFVGLRMPGTLTLEPKTHEAIEAAIDAGCFVELWVEGGRE